MIFKPLAHARGSAVEVCRQRAFEHVILKAVQLTDNLRDYAGEFVAACRELIDTGAHDAISQRLI